MRQRALALPVQAPDGLWLVDRRYDLTFIIGSAVLVLCSHLTYFVLGSNVAVDLVVTMLVGGPHLFATYTMTLMEPDFRRRYPRYVRGALLLPVLIMTLAILNLTLLITVFFFWASAHVIHQAAFVTDAYRMKDPRGWTTSSRIIDYALLFLSLYPIALGKLARGEFRTAGRALLYPAFLAGSWLPVLVGALFAGAALAFVVKTWWEWRTARFNGPKTLHIAVAVALFVYTPLLRNLDVAFQGLNVWHSFQYLALVLYLNRLRRARGFIESPVVQRVSRNGWVLYGVCLGCTVGAGVLFLAVLGAVQGLGVFETGPRVSMIVFGSVFQGQHYFAYYSVVLSFLLVHYYFDHFVFLHVDRRITPICAPAVSQAVA
jgi:hypothetical protein